MHFQWFRITNCFTCQTFQSCAKRDLFPFNFLRASFEGPQKIEQYRIVICPLIIRIILCNFYVQWLQQVQKYSAAPHYLAVQKHTSQYRHFHDCVYISFELVKLIGVRNQPLVFKRTKMPQPARNFFAINSAPHSVYFKPNFQRFSYIHVLRIYVCRKMFSFFKLCQRYFG